MTSSLVGSEMCIRDRATDLAMDGPDGGLEREHGATWLRPTMTELPPVSYTHLTLPTICSV
eukprot:6372197-Prorocentrum_lima.AAC.1